MEAGSESFRERTSALCDVCSWDVSERRPTMYRAQGPPSEPGNSRISVRVHSGGLSQAVRRSSSSFAAAAIACRCSSVGFSGCPLEKLPRDATLMYRDEVGCPKERTNANKCLGFT